MLRWPMRRIPDWMIIATIILLCYQTFIIWYARHEVSFILMILVAVSSWFNGLFLIANMIFGKKEVSHINE